MKDIQYFTEKRMNDKNYSEFMSSLPQHLQEQARTAFPSTVPNKKIVVLQGYKGPAKFLQDDASGDHAPLQSFNGLQEIRVRYGAKKAVVFLTYGISNFFDNRFDWNSMFFSAQTGDYLASSYAYAFQKSQQIIRLKKQKESRQRAKRQEKKRQMEREIERKKERERQIQIQRQRKIEKRRVQKERAERQNQRDRQIQQMKKQLERERQIAREKEQARQKEKKEQIEEKKKLERELRRREELEKYQRQCKFKMQIQKARRKNEIRTHIQAAEQYLGTKHYRQAKEKYNLALKLVAFDDIQQQRVIKRKIQECEFLKLTQEEDQKAIHEAYLRSQKDIDSAIKFLQLYRDKQHNSKLVNQALASLYHAKGDNAPNFQQKIKCFEIGKDLHKSNLLFKGELLGAQATRQMQFFNINQAFNKNEEAIKMLPFKKQFINTNEAIRIITKAISLIRNNYSKQDYGALKETIDQLENISKKNKQSKCITLIYQTLCLRTDRQMIKQGIEEKKAKKVDKKQLVPFLAGLSKNIEKQIANLSGPLAKHVSPDTTNALIEQIKQIKKILVKLGHLQETEAQYKENLIQLGEGLRNFERKEVEMLDKVNFEAMIKQEQIQS